MGALEGDDRCGDIATIESVAHGLETLCATELSRSRLLVDEVLQRGAQTGLHEAAADLRGRALRQLDRRAGRPFGKIVACGGNRGGHERVHREALAGKANRGGGYLAK